MASSVRFKARLVSWTERGADGDVLLVNELAPRPHNSFHETEVACSTSQFEQIVRAVCDLPLGDTRALRPGAIHNLFGDLWLEHDGPPPFERALAGIAAAGFTELVVLQRQRTTATGHFA